MEGYSVPIYMYSFAVFLFLQKGKIMATQKQQVLPPEGFVRLPAVLASIPISRSSFYDGIKKGIYPSPVKLSVRTSAWKVEDIRLLIENLGH